MRKRLASTLMLLLALLLAAPFSWLSGAGVARAQVFSVDRASPLKRPAHGVCPACPLCAPPVVPYDVI